MDQDFDFKGKKVLIAEDDDDTKTMMKDILDMLGCDITFARDGNEVVDLFQKGSYDIILMDIRMPNKDGHTAATEIKDLEKDGKHTPIIALTASIHEAKHFTSFDDLLEKPIRIDDLKEKIKKQLAA